MTGSVVPFVFPLMIILVVVLLSSLSLVEQRFQDQLGRNGFRNIRRGYLAMLFPICTLALFEAKDFSDALNNFTVISLPTYAVAVSLGLPLAIVLGKIRALNSILFIIVIVCVVLGVRFLLVMHQFDPKGAVVVLWNVMAFKTISFTAAVASFFCIGARIPFARWSI